MYLLIWYLLTVFIRTATFIPTNTFLVDFLSVLAVNGMIGLFSIDTIADNAWTELGIGNASVVVPSNETDDYDKDDFVPVALTFDEERPGFKVHGKCGKGEHKHQSKPR